MAMNVQIEEESSGGDEGGDAQEAVVAEINITPLTDVFLVLLIIFMVTSTALVESEVASRTGMKVVLPKSSASGPVSKRNDPILTVTKNNELYFYKRKVDPNNLEAEIRKALEDAGSDTLLLRVDQDVLTGATVDVMSVGKKAGAQKIAIVTDKAAQK
jgi:biopolymer transport protein ExbD